MSFQKNPLLTSRQLFLYICVVLASLLAPESAVAQRPVYTIQVAMDTQANVLTGQIAIHYTNTSQVAMDSLAIHLWPNAYADNSSALVRQMLLDGNFHLYAARPEQRGFISNVLFTSGDDVLTLTYDPSHADIGWLSLPASLAPGESVLIQSPFTVKVPESFSRIGRTGESWQLTQWYPHLAVADSLGRWHTMPYLNHGEYFNDFADYTVMIHTPPGYQVAATGELMESKSDGQQVQFTFKAQNVIDFAWFASPTFQVESMTVGIGDGQTTKLNIFTEPYGQKHWNLSAVYAQRALRFFSDWLGPYPYPSMSVVHTPLSLAGYMEYPMVAQIGHTTDSAFLDLVIAHEIGHTWLYGILANDERTHPWLDEGLTSYLEGQYIAQYQPGYTEQYLPGIFSAKNSMSDSDAFLHVLREQGKLQPPATHPEKQSSFQYGYSAYTLPAMGLQIMHEMLGEDKMKSMFRQYYADHQFTHVTPEKMQSSFESACACDLTWFFESWIREGHTTDYRVRNFNPKTKELTIENHNGAAIPVKLTSYNRGKKVMEHWLHGFEGSKIIHLDSRADEIRLYENMEAVNTRWRGNTRPRSFWPAFSIAPKIGSYHQPRMSVTPFFGSNTADGLMPGIALNSGWLPQQHFKMVIAPMYGLESKAWRGHGELRYIGSLENGGFDKLLLSVSASRFGYHLDTHYLFRDVYTRLSPVVALRMANKNPDSRNTQWLKYRYVHIGQDYGRGINFDTYTFVREQRQYGVHEVAWQLRADHVLRPFTALATVQAGQGFVRVNFNYSQHLVGKDKMRGIWLHGFGGWLPVYEDPKANVLFSFNGTSSNGFFSRDYMYDEWLGGRNETSGIFSRQVFQRDAGLKTLATIGIGDEWMVGGGASIAMPFKVLHFYLDAALYPASISDKTQFSYSGGLAVVLLKDVFEIYIPFVESRDIRESLSYVIRDQWHERISFQANFKLLNPLNLIDRLQYRF